MSHDLHDGHVTAWPTTNTRRGAGTWTRLRERFRNRDEHPGADEAWADEIRNAVDQFGDTTTGRHHADNIPTALIRRPIAAITATPHWPVIDADLGPLVPGPLEPARIHDELIGAEQ